MDHFPRCCAQFEVLDTNNVFLHVQRLPDRIVIERSVHKDKLDCTLYHPYPPTQLTCPLITASSAFKTLLVAAPIATLFASTTNFISKTLHCLTLPTDTPEPFW